MKSEGFGIEMSSLPASGRAVILPTMLQQVVSPPTTRKQLSASSPDKTYPSTQTTSTRQTALVACVHALVSTISSFGETTISFASLKNGDTLRLLLRDAGFSCPSSSPSSQSGQSSSSEGNTTANVLLYVRNQVESTLKHQSGELIVLDDVLLAGRGSPAELAHIIELVLVCCCVHGTRREAHIGAIMSMDVRIQAEIMDVIHYHVGMTEEDEQDEQDEQDRAEKQEQQKQEQEQEEHPEQKKNTFTAPTSSPLADKFRAMMSPEGAAAYSLSANSKLSPFKSGSPFILRRLQLQRRDSMDSQSSLDSMDRLMHAMDDDNGGEQHQNHHEHTTNSEREGASKNNRYYSATAASASAAAAMAAAAEHELKQRLRTLAGQNTSLVEDNATLSVTVNRQTEHITELKKQLDQRTKEGTCLQNCNCCSG
jgi:hypothetical protein